MFSDDKRGGTAPTPTPTHQGLFAHDESTRPRTHDTSASDLVDLNLRITSPVPPQEGVVLRPAPH